MVAPSKKNSRRGVSLVNDKNAIVTHQRVIIFVLLATGNTMYIRVWFTRSRFIVLLHVSAFPPLAVLPESALS
jgi:hypothetical protein